MKKRNEKSIADQGLPERNLERLLLEGLESGEATPLTHADFEKIKNRAVIQGKKRVVKDGEFSEQSDF